MVRSWNLETRLNLSGHIANTVDPVKRPFSNGRSTGHDLYIQERPFLKRPFLATLIVTQERPPPKRPFQAPIILSPKRPSTLAVSDDTDPYKNGRPDAAVPGDTDLRRRNGRYQRPFLATQIVTKNGRL